MLSLKMCYFLLFVFTLAQALYLVVAFPKARSSFRLSGPDIFTQMKRAYLAKNPRAGQTSASWLLVSVVMAPKTVPCDKKRRKIAKIKGKFA